MQENLLLAFSGPWYGINYLRKSEMKIIPIFSKIIKKFLVKIISKNALIN